MIITYPFSRVPSHIGEGRISPNQDLIYVLVPKCGTNTITNLVKDLNNGIHWKTVNTIKQPEFADLPRLVILRDPMTRWRAAAGESLLHVAHNGIKAIRYFAYLNDMFSSKTNIHLASQTYFCHGVDTENTIFIRLEELDEKIQQIFPTNQPIAHMRPSSADNKKVIMNFLDNEYCKDIDVKQNIQQAYADDYALIEYLRINNKFL